jgi:copper homeostasis protein
VHGFVIGFLDNSNEIDEDFNGRLLELIKPLPCTFHRAIDHTSNYMKSIQKVIDMGFDRILTSGGKGNAYDFLPQLKEAQAKFGNKIVILPGGGIRHTNVKEIKETTKCNEFHSAAFVDGKINPGEIKSLLQAIG